MRGRWRWALLLLALFIGTVLLPVSAYLAGGRVIGPYEGTRGLASYLGAIYQDAGRGRVPALLVLFGPAASLLVWYLRSWLLGRSGLPRAARALWSDPSQSGQ